MHPLDVGTEGRGSGRERGRGGWRDVSRWALALGCWRTERKPVPELPGKSTFFVGSTDEFIEKRRQGLQQFLEKVVQNVVLLSDSRLHLFLQSQLSVPEIEACVQGQGPQTVTEAILHYAMSNCGWVQEEESRPALLPGGDLQGSCAGLGSPQGPSCLQRFPYWSDFGMDEPHSDSPEEPAEPLGAGHEEQ
ncbi:sorting nexin-11 isoform 4-T8 [Amazona ochrocephala]